MVNEVTWHERHAHHLQIGLGQLAANLGQSFPTFDSAFPRRLAICGHVRRVARNRRKLTQTERRYPVSAGYH